MNKELVYAWYEQYKTGIYRYALSILKDTHGAEDVLQETFLRLLSGKYVAERFPTPYFVPFYHICSCVLSLLTL